MLSRVIALVAVLLLAVVAGPGQAQELPGLDLSMVDIYSSMPSEMPTLSAAESASDAALHRAAGQEADEVINEAKHAALLMETSASASTSVASTSGHVSPKWDDSVPEIHLKSYEPLEDRVIAGVELVNQLSHSKPELTESIHQMQKAFPVLGHASAQQHQDQSFLQHKHVAAAAATSTVAATAKSTSTAAAPLEKVRIAGQEPEIIMHQKSQSHSSTSTQSVSQSSLQSESHIAAEQSTESNTEGEAMSMSDLEQMMELQGMSQEEIKDYFKQLSRTVVDTVAVAQQSSADSSSSEESEVVALETQAHAETEVEAEAETEVEAESESEAHTESESELQSEQGMESESQVESEENVSAAAVAANDDEGEVVHLKSHKDPQITELETNRISRVTPLHSQAYLRAHAQQPQQQQQQSSSSPRRVHPALRSIQAKQQQQQQQQQQLGYSAPSFLQMRTETHTVQQQQQHQAPMQQRFDPSAVQLGPSRDAYGFHPMTDTEFLHSPPQGPSLAQMSVAYQPTRLGAQWLPPPPPSQAQPVYVVGMGGLQPNMARGPYAGQYGVAAGGAAVQQQPAFIQY